MKKMALLLLSVVLVPCAFAFDPALAKKEGKANFYANITAVEPIMDALLTGCCWRSCHRAAS